MRLFQLLRWDGEAWADGGLIVGGSCTDDAYATLRALGVHLTDHCLRLVGGV